MSVPPGSPSPEAHAGLSDDVVATAVQEIVGVPAREVTAVRRGGYTAAVRRRVRLADGRTVFAKAATSHPAIDWLGNEIVTYTSVALPIMPAMYGFVLEPCSVLVLEDLSDSGWSPSWTSETIDALRDALNTLAATTGVRLQPLSVVRGGTETWRNYADGGDLGRLAVTGACTTDWIETFLSTLIEEEAAANFDGDCLVHCDLRGDNINYSAGRLVVIDWNWACLGNPVYDHAGWAVNARLEGAPAPWVLAPGVEAPAVAAFAGIYSHTWMPPSASNVTPSIRSLERKMLSVLLQWFARLRELRMPWTESR
jgi:Phosphotransferase enzyme family